MTAPFALFVVLSFIVTLNPMLIMSIPFWYGRFAHAVTLVLYPTLPFVPSPAVHPPFAVALYVPFLIWYEKLSLASAPPRNKDAFLSDEKFTHIGVFPVLFICNPLLQPDPVSEQLLNPAVFPPKSPAVLRFNLDVGFPVPKLTLVSILQAVELPKVRLRRPATIPVASNWLSLLRLDIIIPTLNKLIAIAKNKSEAKLTVCDVPDKPGVAAKIFKDLSLGGVSVDMIVQNVSHTRKTDISFTISKANAHKAMKLTKKAAAEIGAGDIVLDEDIARVGVVGIGMKSHPGVAAKMFDTLAENKINIEMISTSDISISCIIKKKFAETAVKSLHKNFGLGA